MPAQLASDGPKEIPRQSALTSYHDCQKKDTSPALMELARNGKHRGKPSVLLIML